MRILVIEDDKRTSDYVVKGFTESGHLVEALSDGRDALVHATHTPYDVIVVDRMLPGIDGLSLVRALRASGNHTPAIFLTSVGGVDDRVDGLEAGADDYLVKPFAFSELLARVNALGRRPPVQAEKTVCRSPISSWTRRGELSVATASVSTCSLVSSRCLKCLCVMRVASSLVQCCSSGCGTSISIPRPAWSKPISAASEPRSTSHSRWRCSTPSAALDTASMRRSELLGSTAFRLAVGFSGLFFATFFIAGVFAYQMIMGDLNERLDRTLAESFDLISRSYDDSDLEDLVATVQSYAAATQQGDRVFYLDDSAGTRLAGNVQQAEVRPGLSTVSGDVFGLSSDNRFRVRRGMVGGRALVVGFSFEETDELGNLALTSFAWAGALATLIAIAAGAVLAGVVQKRMQAIATTMSRVGHGELTARIPIRGSGDDVDALSGQINAALERLAALVEGMRQVSVDIAHDLKTPLNRLSISIETALEKAERGDSNAAELVQAQHEALQINGTFEALLRIAQLESGARRARFIDVSVEAVLIVLVEAYAYVAAENGQTLSLDPVRGATIIKGDCDLLTQLFANLIENAIRHGRRGTRITLSAAAEADRLVVAISDDGPGIPAGEREKVFQRLYRLEKSRTTPGTGLGLSMVKAIADLHGARVELSDGGPGLRVTVTFATPNPKVAS